MQFRKADLRERAVAHGGSSSRVYRGNGLGHDFRLTDVAGNVVRDLLHDRA